MPQNQLDVDNLRTTLVEIGVERNSAMLLDPFENENGQWVDSEGNQVSSFFLDLLTDTRSPYSLLYGANGGFPFGSNLGFTRFNIVCEKPVIFVGKFCFYNT